MDTGLAAFLSSVFDATSKIASIAHCFDSFLLRALLLGVAFCVDRKRLVHRNQGAMKSAMTYSITFER